MIVLTTKKLIILDYSRNLRGEASISTQIEIPFNELAVSADIDKSGGKYCFTVQRNNRFVIPGIRHSYTISVDWSTEEVLIELFNCINTLLHDHTKLIPKSKTSTFAEIDSDIHIGPWKYDNQVYYDTINQPNHVEAEHIQEVRKR